MKALFITMLFAATIVSCSKEYVFENTGSGTNKTQKDTTSTSQDNDEYLSVEAALGKDYGEEVSVRGYIVASCEKNIKNIDYTYPFKGSTAIVLADDTVGRDSVLPTPIMTVCLTDWKQLRNAYNLEDNPDQHNKRVLFTGTVANYLSVKGLKHITMAFNEDE